MYGTGFSGKPASRPVSWPARLFESTARDRLPEDLRGRDGCSGQIRCLDQGLGLASDAEKFTLPLVWRWGRVPFCRMALKCAALSAWNIYTSSAKPCYNPATYVLKAYNLRWSLIRSIAPHRTLVLHLLLRISSVPLGSPRLALTWYCFVVLLTYWPLLLRIGPPLSPPRC